MTPFLDKILFKLEKGRIGDSTDCWSQTNTRTSSKEEDYIVSLGLVLGPSVQMETVCLCAYDLRFKFLCGPSRGQPRLGTGNPNCVIPT